MSRGSHADDNMFTRGFKMTSADTNLAILLLLVANRLRKKRYLGYTSMSFDMLEMHDVLLFNCESFKLVNCFVSGVLNLG